MAMMTGKATAAEVAVEVLVAEVVEKIEAALVKLPAEEEEVLGAIECVYRESSALWRGRSGEAGTEVGALLNDRGRSSVGVRDRRKRWRGCRRGILKMR